MSAQQLTGASLRARLHTIADIHGLLLTEAVANDGRAELQVAAQDRWTHTGLPSGRATGAPALRYWNEDLDVCYEQFASKLRYDMSVDAVLFTDAISAAALKEIAEGADLLGLRVRRLI